MILNKYLLQTKDGYIKSTVTKDSEYITVFLFLVTETLTPKTQSD